MKDAAPVNTGRVIVLLFAVIEKPKLLAMARIGCQNHVQIRKFVVFVIPERKNAAAMNTDQVTALLIAVMMPRKLASRIGGQNCVQFEKLVVLALQEGKDTVTMKTGWAPAPIFVVMMAKRLDMARMRGQNHLQSRKLVVVVF